MSRTPKARALGNAIRQAREDQGLSLRAFGARISRDIGQISRWENGERTPKPEHLAQILTALGIKGEPFDSIIKLSRSAEESRWVATTLPEQAQQLAALVDFEKKATRIIDVAPLIMPGLLQTESYIRAMMETGEIPPDELADRVATRLGRREILKPPNPVRLVAFVGEAALHQVMQSRHVLIDQLRFLFKAATWPNIDIRVIPLSRGWHPGLDGPFMLIESTSASPVVHLENRRSGLFLHDRADVCAYQEAVDKLHDAAIDMDESARLIASVIAKMERAS
jgi:transcriptional regulator with XRE-family HTH domain